MKVYIKFITQTYLKSLILRFLIMLSLVFILNILTEIEFFKDTKVSLFYFIFIFNKFSIHDF